MEIVLLASEGSVLCSFPSPHQCVSVLSCLTVWLYNTLNTILNYRVQTHRGKWIIQLQTEKKKPKRPDCACFIIFFLHISAFVIDIILNIGSDYRLESQNESGLECNFGTRQTDRTGHVFQIYLQHLTVCSLWFILHWLLHSTS